MGLDWKQLVQLLVPIVAAKAPQGSKVDKAAEWLVANQGLITIIEGVVGQLTGDKQPHEVKPVETLPVVPVQPPAVVITPAGPVAQPQAPARVVKSIGLRVACIQQHSNGGQLYDKAAFDLIMSGANPVAPGDRIHLDATPVDSNGVKYVTGDPANALLNFSYFSSDDRLELHGADHDAVHNFGCTPVYKVPVDWTGEEQATFYQVDEASGVTSNEVGLRIKN